jgi:hypothetical protein
VNSKLKVRVGQVGLFVAGGVATAGIGLGTAVASSAPSAHHDSSSSAVSIVDPNHSHKPIGTIYQRTELYFGTDREALPPVTDAQFEAFVDATITPAFPDGLTELTGDGQWLGDNGPVQERSHEVILLYPTSDRTASNRIETIRTAYKKQFEQESVLRDDSLDRVSF